MTGAYDTDITMILDRSGSMGSVVVETIEGFNRLVEQHRRLPGRATLTLVQFDDQSEVVYEGVDLRDVPPLDYDVYRPRGATALLDAIGTGIRLASTRLLACRSDERPRHVVFVILTDGLENASTEFDRKLVFDMIRHQRERNYWQFVFLGANQDAIAEARGIGIPAHAARGFHTRGGGTLEAFDSVSRGLQSFRTSSQDGSGRDRERFFTDSGYDASTSREETVDGDSSQ
jgi:hypothetical protein